MAGDVVFGVDIIHNITDLERTEFARYKMDGYGAGDKNHSAA
jgi:hypothetical protein